jgi:hypothetical protein
MRSKLAKPSSSRSNGIFANAGKRSSNGIQAKLKTNKPGDQYEVEADKTADHVVGQSMGSILSSKSSAPGADFGKPLPVTLRPTVSSSAQRKEEDVQAKESENQSESEDVQLKESEIAPMGMSDKDLGEEDPIRAQAIQMKEDESVQLQEEEEESEDTPLNSPEIQTKEEEVQAKEDENVQLQEDEGVQLQEEEVQAKEDEGVQLQEDEGQAKEDEEVQAKEFVSSPQPTTQTPIDQKLSDSKGAGSPLPMGVKAEMESGFGVDFTDVRIHTDTRAESMNQEVGAKAFTHKEDIYFNQGKFDPESKEGKLLLAHELTHTIQQGAVAPKAGEETSTTGTEEEKQKSASSPTTAAPTTSKDTTSGAKAPTAPVQAIEVEKTDETAEGEEKQEEPPTPENAESDPNFIELVGNIEETAEEQTEHDPSGELSNAAQDSAESPSNERQSMAEASQVDAMEEVAEEPKEFDKDGFKAKVMERIESMQIPENQEEADEFDDHNNIAQVNKAAVSDVKAEQEKTTGPVDQTTNAEPNTAAVPERDIKDLKKPRKAPKPQKVDGAKATPPVRNESKVSKPLEDEASKMDQTMAENDVTDEQLAKSEEPKFENALDSKNTAKENTKTAPVEFRQQEQGVLASTAQKSGAKGNEELGAMHAVRGLADTKVLGDQKQTAKKDTSEREKIANHINKIYTNTKKDVDNILDKLETKVTDFFEKYSELAKAAFEDYVAKQMDDYKARRYSGVLGAGRWLADLFMGLPDEVNQFFVDGRNKFMKKMEEGIEIIAEYVANELNRAKARIQRGRDAVNTYVESLPKNLQHLGKEAAEEIQDKFSALDDDVNSREESLVDSLAQQYMSTLEEVDERIEEMKEANKGLIDAALGFINGVIETILKLKEMIVNLFSAIQSVIGVIMEDPIGFMKNLFDGIGKGIDAFKANIQTHMLGGLITWLTGSLGPMGITLPDDIFSLKGIFSLVMQVLGLGWDFIRQKAVMMMGEPMVNALTKGYDMFTTFASQGVMGIWEYLKDQFSDLKETVIEAIKGMLITQVIEAGIKWLFSLLIPGAGFIKAIMAIKDLIVFFVEAAMMLIPAVTEAILALAAGSVAGVAMAIEKGLSMLIALVINLFAKLIGLGGLTKKVMAIFKKIRKRVDRAIMKLLNKAKKAGKKLMAKLGFGKKKEEIKGKQKGDGEVGEVVPFGKGHKLFINTTGGKITVISQSARMPVVGRIKQWTSDANAIENPEKKQALLSLLSQAKGKLTETEKHALKAEQLKDAKTSDEKAFIKADDATEKSEHDLATILEQIYELLDKNNAVQLDPITVNFGPIPNKYDKAEYFSQLKGQEEGINTMNVDDWLTNRTRYSAQGRAEEGDSAQSEYRRSVFAVLVKLKQEREPNLTRGQVNQWAQDYMDTQAALHDPDQIAGGDPLGIARGDYDSMLGLGSRRINSSIGSRWKTRVEKLQNGVLVQISAKKLSKDQQRQIHMKSILNM